MLLILQVLDGLAIGALVGCAAWFGAVRRALVQPDWSRGHQPLVPLTPARQSPPARSPAGGPVEPPVAAGEEPAPGSAAVPDNAARESTETVVTLGAGASFRLPVPSSPPRFDDHDPDRDGAGGWPPIPAPIPPPLPVPPT